MTNEQYHLAQLTDEEREKLTNLENEFGKVLIAWEDERAADQK
ncbi:hypothetical protein [Halobacillus sp. Marseille-Q1614]|nr:hypothetical protein [Halobacillus sp. Marseille-Q1614]